MIPVLQRLRSRQEGYTLVVAVLTVTLVMLSGLALLSRGVTEQRMSKNKVDTDRASYAAMAGIEHCMGYLAWDPAAATALTGLTAGRRVCEQSGTHDDATYTVVADAQSASEIRVTSTGHVGPASSGSQRTVSMLLKYNIFSSRPGISYGGEDSLAYGGGTVTIEGGSIIDGDLYSFGNITFAGNASTCGAYIAKGVVDLRTEPDKLRTGCNNSYLSGVPDITAPVFEEYLKTIPATLPDDLTGHTLYKHTGDLALKCAQSGTGTRMSYCDGPSDLKYATVVWVTGALTLDKFNERGGPITEQYFTGNVIFVVDGDIDIKVKDIIRQDSYVNGVLAHKTVLQLMTINGVIKLNANNITQGHLVSLKNDITILNTKINGLVIAENWTINNSTLQKDSYLITALHRPVPGVDPGDPDAEEATTLPDPSEEPRWQILGFGG